METCVPRRSADYRDMDGQRVHPCPRNTETEVSLLVQSGAQAKETDMSLSETSVDSLALAIANSGSWERMAYFLPLIRLLSNGHPVSLEQLATALERPFEEVTEVLRQFEDIVSDEDGRIVGAGLSLLPTPYRFEVNGHVLYTWCALDTLIFPVWLGRSAQVSSACPATGQPIHLTVTPECLEHFDPPS